MSLKTRDHSLVPRPSARAIFYARLLTPVAKVTHQHREPGDEANVTMHDFMISHDTHAAKT